MSNMNTQAGWEIVGSEYDDTLYVMPKDMQDGLGGRDTIAIIPGHLHDKEEKARLIAAAPDLFAECERLRAELTTRRARDAETHNAMAMALQHIRLCAPDPTVDAALDAAILPFQRNGAKT